MLGEPHGFEALRSDGNRSRRADHNFSGTPFTIGIEEELMICDSETLELAQAIEQILAAVPDDIEGEVKPELMQSVLEVATTPCAGRQARRATSCATCAAR